MTPATEETRTFSLRDVYVEGPCVVQMVAVAPATTTHLTMYYVKNGMYSLIVDTWRILGGQTFTLTLGFALKEGEQIMGIVSDDITYSVGVYSSTGVLEAHKTFSPETRFPSRQDLEDIFA